MKKLRILIMATLLAACGGKTVTETTATDESATPESLTLNAEQLNSAGIETGLLKKNNMSSLIKVFGVIDVPPQSMVSVSLPLGGYLKSTHLLPGMPVKENEVIAVVEDPQFIQLQQDFLASKNKLRLNEQEYNRQKELNANKAGSDKALQVAEAEYANQKILVKSLSEKLKLISVDPEKTNENNLSRSVKITSPIHGFVSKVNVNIGKYVMPSEVLFELVNPEDIHLNLKVFEKDLKNLFIGQELMAYNNSQPDKKYLCKVLLISQDLGPDRSAVVHCHFEQYDKSLLPGMYMNGEIELHSEDAYALPSDAIVTFENKPYVFIASPGNHFRIKEVKTGISQHGMTQILAESAPDLMNQKIVTKGAYTLLMQLKNKNEEE